MSEITLSFEQLREAIFGGILDSLVKKSYSDLHTAVISGKDPRQIILPRPEDAMHMGNYGTLNLNFNIPDEYPVSLTIVLTMGRIAYTVQAESHLCQRGNLRQGMFDLGVELGLNCDWRVVRGVERFEYSDSQNLLSTEDIMNILGAPQLEFGFKEFMTLQVDRLVIGVANLLADAGLHREVPAGFFALCVMDSFNNEHLAEAILKEKFHIFAKDARDSKHTVYGLVSVSDDAKPLKTCASVAARLRVAGFECAFRPTFKYLAIDDQSLDHFVPVEPLVAHKTSTSKSTSDGDYFEPTAPVVWKTETSR
ncbi:hypothetical protein V0M98_38795 (plasmid) [Pseudomonas silesiensis]|uniref:hypothetical protein n=1 Tax=Pseudomonas silesiensis TaxID=1853130 RepID=UPI0030CF95D4